MPETTILHFTSMVFPNPFPSSKSRIVMVVLLAAFFIAGGIYLFHIKGNTSQSLSTRHSSNKVVNAVLNSNQGTQWSNTEQASTLSLPAKAGLSGYVSQTNKFGFYFTPKQGGASYAVKENGNKISIYNIQTNQTPVFMEVFQKIATDTIQQAITKAVLNGYNLQDCPIMLGNYTGHTLSKTIQTAQINYAASNRPTYGAGIGDITKCPHTYTVDDDAPYFLVDSTHPNELLFFYNGQIGISAGANQNGNPVLWSDTFTFVQ